MIEKIALTRIYCRFVIKLYHLCDAVVRISQLHKLRKQKVITSRVFKVLYVVLATFSRL